jgi:endo-1,4-beta-xylanase
MKKQLMILTGLLLIFSQGAMALTWSAASASIRQNPDVGHLWANGEVAEYISLPQTGFYEVRVVAAGTPAGGEYPLMALSVDGLARDAVSVTNSTAWEEYAFQAELESGVHTLGVQFLNDAMINGEDRNLFLDSMTVTALSGAAPSLASEAEWFDAMRAREAAMAAAADAGIRENRMDSSVITVLDANGNPVEGAVVSVEQVSHDFLFGASLAGWEQFGNAEDNAAYLERFNALFNYATVPFYWALTEPVEGSPDYARTDAMVNWCVSRGIEVKGHAVLWGELLPDWTNGAIPPESKQQARVESVLGRYLGLVDKWEVLNEPVNAPGFSLPLAHDWARNLDPDAFLLVNEYGQFYNGLPDFHALIENAQAEGTPVDAVGIQAHAPIDTAFPLAEMQGWLDWYGELGHEIHITEFTPGSNGNPVLASPWRGVWDEAAQADYAEDFYRICFSHPDVKAISWWDFCDVGAWVPGGGMLRSDLSPKPVYERLNRLINEEWKTASQGESQIGGAFYFTGYHGTYRVRISYAGEAAETEIQLRSREDNQFEIRLDYTAAGVDEEAPVVSLNGANPMTVEAGTAWTDPGAEAADNLDGDLTDMIHVEDRVNTSVTGWYQVTYEVSDSAGNSAQADRMVHVSDTLAPAITLNGSASVTVEQHTGWTDPGVAAADSFEGDLSAAVTVTGTVDTSKTGVYTLTYNVADAAGNAAAPVTRTVEVTAPATVYIGIIGDVNKDGRLEQWDATLIQYVAYYGEAAVNDWLRSQGKAEVDVRLADVDRDGAVVDFDATLLRYSLWYGLDYVNNWLSSNALPLAHTGAAYYE